MFDASIRREDSNRESCLGFKSTILCGGSLFWRYIRQSSGDECWWRLLLSGLVADVGHTAGLQVTVFACYGTFVEQLHGWTQFRVY